MPALEAEQVLVWAERALQGLLPLMWLELLDWQYLWAQVYSEWRLAHSQPDSKHSLYTSLRLHIAMRSGR